jgi:hypothetical protein
MVLFHTPVIFGTFVYHNPMDTTTPAPTPPARVTIGQQWRKSGSSVWTVRNRRGRASGFQEVLLVSSRGARRWVMDSDLLGEWAFVAHSEG